MVKGFGLVESILYKNGKYFLLSRHIKRLKKSMNFFGFEHETGKITKTLKKYSEGLKKDKSYKVKMILDFKGKAKIKDSIIKHAPKENRLIGISSKKTVSSNVFLRHKTTNRGFYDSEYKKYTKKGFYDVIFFNKKNQLTEAHSSNIFIKKGEYFYTPPVSCGLLPGTYRNYLIDRNPGIYKEKLLYKKDLYSADEIYICNSVRGMRKVNLKQY